MKPRPLFWTCALAFWVVGCHDHVEVRELEVLPECRGARCAAPAEEDILINLPPQEREALVVTLHDEERCDSAEVACIGCGTDAVPFAFELDVANVSGTLIPMAGASPLLDGIGTPSVTWVDTQTLAEYPAPLVEAETYALQLFAGRYDVYLDLGVGSPLSCPYGCRFILAEDVVISGSSSDMDLELKTARLHGTLLMDGEAVPVVPQESPVERGSVVLVDQNTATMLSAPLTSTGAAQFTTTVLQDQTYDLYWFPTSNLKTFESPPNTIPAGMAYLGEITPDGTTIRLVLNAETTLLTGEVTADGQRLPDDPLHDGVGRGVMRFWNTHDTMEGASQAPVGELGAARFEVRLFKGEYKIRFDTLSESYQTGLAPSTQTWLCGGYNDQTQSLPTCSLEALRVFDVNLSKDDMSPGIPVSGRVSFQGIDPQILTGNNLGSLGFRPRDGGLESWARVVGSEGQFEAWLQPGVYDVWFSGTRRQWGDERVPLGRTQVAEGWVLGETQSDLVFTAEVVALSGEVLMNGGLMPDDEFQDGDPRGTLEFQDPQSGQIALVDVGETGPATYEIYLLRGSYEARLTSFLMARGIRYYSQSVLPNGTKELGVLDLAQTPEVLQHDFGVQVRTVHGSLDVGGEALEALPESNNATHVRFIDSTTQHAFETEVAPEGGQFSVLLYTGAYEAELTLEYPAYMNPLPYGRTPIKTQCAVVVED